MISRRTLLGAVSGLIFFANNAQALGRKPKAKPEAPLGGGPRTIARQEWPPAITPEYAGIVDRGYACFADDMGRLAVVDLKREDNPLVIGELFGIGRKVVALSITQHRAVAVVQVEQGADTVFQLVLVSLTPANDISIMSRTTLANFTEPCSVASYGDLVAIGGSGLNNENQIVFYSLGKKKGVEPQQISAVTLEQSPFHLDLQDRLLLALTGADNSDLIVISTANPRAPEKLKILHLDGRYSALARNRDQIMLAGSSFDRRFYAKLVTLKPSAELVSSVVLPAVSDVLDIAAQKGQFLVLTNQGGRQAVQPLIIGKGRKPVISLSPPVLLPGGKRGASPRAHIAAKDKDAYIATDWGAVQVLNVSKNGWQFSYSHTIPRLPASAIVLFDDLAVIACAELKVYDLKEQKHPVLLDSTDIPSTIRQMLPLGRSFLCLSKDILSVRSCAKPSELVSSIKVSGNALAYDKSTNSAYVFSATEKGSQCSIYKIQDELIRAAGTYVIAAAARKAQALSGKIALAGLNELNVFKLSESEPQLLGTRKFPNLALRDFAFAGPDLIYLTCIDENLKGLLIAVSLSKDDLPVLGACEVPQDALTLALSQNKAVVLGRGKNNKDMLSLLSIADPARLRLLESFETIEAASAVTIKGNVAVVAGRGLELVDIS